jgi:ribosomal RNA-processing protein 12
LYSQPELRPSILKALKIIVDSNLAISRQDESKTLPDCDITPAEAVENTVFLRTQAESWLYVFFNIFESIGSDGRGMVGEVISAWAAIANSEVRSSHLRCINCSTFASGYDQSISKSY